MHKGRSIVNLRFIQSCSKRTSKSQFCWPFSINTGCNHKNETLLVPRSVPRTNILLRGVFVRFWANSPRDSCANCAQLFETVPSSQNLTLSAQVGNFEYFNVVLRLQEDSELLLINFCRAVASTKSARARTGVSPHNGQNRHFLLKLHEKNALFRTKQVQKHKSSCRRLVVTLANDCK